MSYKNNQEVWVAGSSKIYKATIREATNLRTDRVLILPQNCNWVTIVESWRVGITKDSLIKRLVKKIEMSQLSN